MKKAFTLIELLVYMAIMSFIIIVAGRAFSDSTSMRVRTQNMTKASEEVNKVAAILREDISQMGAKSWKVNNTDNFLVAEKVYYNLTATPQPDSSSYNLDKSNANWHKFVFHKVHYKDNGECSAVLKITWEVKPDSSLWRKCEQLDDPKCPKSVSISKDECPDSLAMATGVEKFTLLESKPVISDILFPKTGESTFKLIDRGNQNQVKQLSSPISDNKISGFVNNGANPNQKYLNQILVGASNTSPNACHKFTFKKDTVYAIQFRTPIIKNGDVLDPKAISMARFKPGIDHIAVGLANYTNLDNVFQRFMFWPPQTSNSDEENHYMEFSLSAKQETCIAFEFSFYNSSEAANGTLKIEDFEVIQKNDKAYNFDGTYTILPENKKNVKAFKLNLKVKRKSEIGNIEGMVIPTPNNGIKATATGASP